MPLPNNASQPINLPQLSALGVLTRILTSIESITFQEIKNAIEVKATHNSWSRSARRKKIHQQEQADVVEAQVIPRMHCKIWFAEHEGREEQPYVHGRWVWGEEREMWESFWNHIVRRLLNDFKR